MVQTLNFLNQPLTLKTFSIINDSKNSVSVIVFMILDYLFALSVRAVHKIIPCPPLDLNFENGIGTIDLKDETITIVDLKYKFKGQSSDKINTFQSQNGFLILIQTITGENCAIFTEQAPVLFEIPLQNIRPLPLSHGEIGKLSFVTHMAILPQPERQESLKIFLVSMNQIIASKLGISLPKTSLLTNETKDVHVTQRFLRVVLGKGEALLPVDVVCSAVQIFIEKIYPTPAFPEWFLGIYPWKGQMLRLIDLDLLMGYPSVFSRHLKRKAPVAIVLELQTQFFGFLVANVYDVESYELNKMKALENNNFPVELKKFVRGVFSEDRWVLDLDRLSKTVHSIGNDLVINQKRISSAL